MQHLLIYISSFLILIGLLALAKFLIMSVKIIWRYSRGNSETRSAIRLLCSIYKPWSICLIEILEYSKEAGSLKARMHAPRDYSYTWFRPECVTGIHYDLALSELDYIFVHNLIRDGVVTLISDENFEKLKLIASQIIALEADFAAGKKTLSSMDRHDKPALLKFKKELVLVKKDLRKRRHSFSLLLWRNPVKAEEAFFRKFKNPLRSFIKAAYYSKNWFESLFWRPFSPEQIVMIDRREFEQLLFERLMEKYKLVFIEKKIEYKSRTMLLNNFELSLAFKKLIHLKNGLPLIIIEVGADTISGTVKNVALLSEIEA